MDKSLEESVRKELERKNFFNQAKCILEKQPGSGVGECSDYGTEICENSKYRDQCNYIKRRK